MKRNPGSTIAFLRNWGTLLVAAALFVAPVNGALADPGGTDRPHLSKCDTAFDRYRQPFSGGRDPVSCHFRHLGRDGNDRPDD